MGIYETLVISFLERAMLNMVLVLMPPEQRPYYLMMASIMNNLVRVWTGISDPRMAL